MHNKSHYKSILSGIQTAVSKTEEAIFNQELIDSLKEEVSPITGFFGTSDAESIILAYFLNANMKDTETTKSCIMSHFGKDISAMADVNEIIESLSDKRLVIKKGANRRRYRYNYKFVVVNPKAMLAMTEGDLTLMELRPVETFGEFLLDVTDLIIQRINDNITTINLVEEVNKLMELNTHLDEVKWILSQKELKGVDLIIFLDVCIEHGSGEDEVDIEKILKEIIDSVPERMQYKQLMKMDKCFLMNNNYLILAGEAFGMFTYVQLSDHSMDNLFSHMKELTSKPFQPRMGQLISFESLQDEKLVYNPKEYSQIKTLANALENEKYLSITGKMTKNNMKAGFTILMHGYPGTGKTSSVKSLARITKRHIYMVDIPKVNSKWVGESEKNLSKLFAEYRRARKHFDKDPILLFNEADAILGKRIAANSSVDKMNNSLQNILLQELEDFEGIFIATTNLAEHLDNAFDRRLLYKLEFKKPEEPVRFEILRNSFPNIDDDILNTINHDYPLTGGQIANIKKKILVKELLEQDIDLDLELLSLCEEEISLRKSGARTPIGFISHNIEKEMYSSKRL
jgi:hypothetical protein